MNKMKTIKFEFQPYSVEASKFDTEYKCLQITESIDYKPGTFYNEGTVKELCLSRNWKVTVVAE